MESTDSGGLSAREAGLVRCAVCGRVAPQQQAQCVACGARLRMRKHFSLQRTWAFLLVGVMAYVPANLWPIMLTRSVEGAAADTIYSGVLKLVGLGSYFVAAVVFVASICIPMAKFIIIAALALTVQRGWRMSGHTAHRLHTIIEFIGRWSMIDVFVVAVLAALINLGAIITIAPGDGIKAFALSVVFTMLAANSLDARMIWDHAVADTDTRHPADDPVPDEPRSAPQGG